MDVSIDPEKILEMKYAELRKIAKSVGIKANQKADKLVKSLQEYLARERIDIGKPASSPAISNALTSLQNSVGISTSPLVCSTIKASKRLRRSLIRPSTPMSASRCRPSAKMRTPVQRLRTPPLNRRRSRSMQLTTLTERLDTLITASGQKRSRVLSGEEGQSAKKQRINDCIEQDICIPPRQRSRTNTYDKDTALGTPAPISSPGTQDLLNSMGSTETDANRKKNLMAALDKRVQEKMAEGKSTTQIPRFVAFCALKKQAAEQNLTPGQQRYAKAHENTFNKMPSLGQYLESKKKRAEALTSSAQKVHAEQTTATLRKLKALADDAPTIKTQQQGEKQPLVNTPANSGRSNSFVPKVELVSRVNFDFTGSKKSESTARRKSPRISALMPEKENVTKPTSQTRPRSLHALVTPYKFCANGANPMNVTSQQKSAVKPKFDLTASLKKPVTWKTHKGKLKTFDGPDLFRKDIRTVKVTTKDQRRQQFRVMQAERRHGTQMKRRGLQS